MFFKKNKNTAIGAKTSIEEKNKKFAEKINSQLPEDIIEAKSSSPIVGNRYKVHLNIDEEADINVHRLILINPAIYKSCLILLILNFIMAISISMILYTKEDSQFYASSPDGRIWKLDTRETPNGSFKIQQHKEAK